MEQILQEQKPNYYHQYNLSQQKEKSLFVNILYDLCNLIEEPMNFGKGRKPCPVKDIIFAFVMKQYLNTSSRRLQSDLKLFSEVGFINYEIPFTTLLGSVDKRYVTDLLKELIEISSLPLKHIETDFAIDSTGFSISRYETFYHYKHKRNVKWKEWRKCHAVCGVKTNIITSVEITEGRVHDQNQFQPLATHTSKNFKIREFSGDKAYLCSTNFKLIKELGGQAYIPFKKNTTGKVAQRDRSYFKTAFKLYNEDKEKYLKHYHKRSNIESTFSMIKRKFGNNLKCKKEISQDNEILAKCLANNICILIKERFTRNVDLCTERFINCGEFCTEKGDVLVQSQ